MDVKILPEHPEMHALAWKLAEGQVVQAVNHPLNGPGKPLFEAVARFLGYQVLTHGYTVLLPQRKGVGRHDHDEDVCLYYPDGSLSSPLRVWLPDGTTEDIDIPPGGVLFVPKKTFHEVPDNPIDKPRLSVAVKVVPNDDSEGI